MKNLVLSLLIKAKDKAGATISGLQSRISSLGKKSSTAAKGTDKLSRSLDQNTKSASKAGAALGKFFAGFLGYQAIRKATQAVKGWVTASNVQQRAETKLATTLRNLTNASDDQIAALKKQASALQELTGYGDEATISAQAMLGTFKLSAQEIGTLTPRLLDMAESARKAGDSQGDLESTAIAVGKALSSGIGTLSRYGIAMSDAQKEAFKLADQEEKVRILAEVLDGNFKGLAASVGQEYEGAVRKAAAAQGDFYEVLGRQITDNPQIVAATDDLKSAWEEMASGISASSGEIGGAISFLGKTVRATFAGIKIVWNTTQIGFKGLVLVINEGIQKINEGLALITWGDVSKEFKAAANEIAAENAKMRGSILDDVDDIVEGGRRFAGVFADVSDEAGEVPSLMRELSRETKSAAREMDKGADSGDALADALEAVGVSLQEIRTGLSADTINRLRAMGAAFGDSALNGEHLVQTLVQIANESDSPTVVAKAVEQMNRAFREGRVDREQLNQGLEAIRDHADGAAEGLQNLSTAFDSAKTVQEIDAVVQSLRVMRKEKQITDAQFQQGMKGATAAYGQQAEASKKSADASQNATYEAQKAASAQNTAALQAQANAQAQEKAQKEATTQAQRSGGMAETLMLIYERGAKALSQYSDAAVSMYRGMVEGSGKAAQSADTLANRMQRVRKGLWDAETMQASDAFNRWLKKIHTSYFKVEMAAIKAAEGAKRMYAGLQSGQLSLRQLNAMASRAGSSMKLLGEEKLQALLNAINSAKGALLQLNAAAKSTLNSLQDELLQLEGNEAEIAKRRMERRRADLEAQLAEAESKQGKDMMGRVIESEAVKDLKEALRVLAEIEKKQAAINKEAKRQKKAVVSAEEKEAPAPSTPPPEPASPVAPAPPAPVLGTATVPPVFEVPPIETEKIAEAVQKGIEKAFRVKIARVDFDGVEVYARAGDVGLLQSLARARMAS